MATSQAPEDPHALAARQFQAGITDLKAVLDRLDASHQQALFRLAEAVLTSWAAGGKLLVCGNGGSAADSQHIVAELVGRFHRERAGLPALALTTDTSILTSVGNDYGFAEIFARQVTGLARPGDVLLVISTSGNSENCVRAVAAARRLDLTVGGFLGQGGGKLASLVDVAVVVPCDTVPEIQEVHITLGHLLCRLLETLPAPGTSSGDGHA